MPDDIARAEEKCMERLKSKIQVLETSYDFDTARLEEKCERLQKQLEIAVKALDSLRGICFPERAEKALKEIKELNK